MEICARELNENWKFFKSRVVEKDFSKRTFEKFQREKLLTVNEFEHSWREGRLDRHWNSLGDTFFPAVSHLGYVKKKKKLAYASSRTSSAILLRSCSSFCDDKNYPAKEHPRGIEIEMRRKKWGENCRRVVATFINEIFLDFEILSLLSYQL